MVTDLQYQLSDSAITALREYIPKRMNQAHFANARSIRNAIDRAKLRQANRLFATRGKTKLTKAKLMTLEGEDFRQSRIFSNPEVAT